MTISIRFVLLSSIERLLTLSIFLALALPGIASPHEMRVEGVVHDATGASVAGAQVELRTDSYSAKTTTSATGMFSFENVSGSSGTIIATAPGFKETQQSWNATSGTAVQLVIVLQPASVNQEVLVTAARTSTPIGQTPISDIQLTNTDLAATPALTLDDALRQVPGFSLFRRNSSRTANPTTLGVSLRGLGANGASR
ncbi:MAG: carboxypeptidase regulatory-like domain-containing protein [Candidatus Acidiferrales bacterium]